jgi:cytochrome b pre-mRNA-processing protein 3
MLASVAALLLVRLEQAGKEGDAASVALTERFTQVMESEHREIGLGDPALGRTVRKLVGSLSRRDELWRAATAGGMQWEEAARQSVYKGEIGIDALQHTARTLNALWLEIERTAVPALADRSLEG